MTQKNSQPHEFHEWIRLEQPRLGTRVVYATDDFFGAKERIIDPADAVFIEDKYDENGKWMDGWESRRKRVAGHDYCVIRLGLNSIVHGVEIDTSHFTGNNAPAASIEVCSSDQDLPQDGWQEVLSKTDLTGDSRATFRVAVSSPVTHVRLHIYPDGGVARLRIFGEILPDSATLSTGESDLLALENGGRALLCSDEHYGSMHNLNVAGRGVNMGDGWETARRRGPGNDWVILGLGTSGNIGRVVLDTAHFKGNYPDRAAIHAGYFSGGSLQELASASRNWPVLLPECKLGPDGEHEYVAELADCGTVSHVRLSMYPDGGISRLRLFGHAKPAEPGQ